FDRYRSRAPPAPPSFPTRRSSDLHRDRHRSAGTELPGGVEPFVGAVRARREELTFGTEPLDLGGVDAEPGRKPGGGQRRGQHVVDRKSTRLNSSHLGISYAVFCLK